MKLNKETWGYRMELIWLNASIMKLEPVENRSVVIFLESSVDRKLAREKEPGKDGNVDLSKLS